MTSHAPTAAKPSPWFPITAVVGWIGVVTVYLCAAFVPRVPQTYPMLYGHDGISTAQRVFETAFYFTVLSATVVAVVRTLL